MRMFTACIRILRPRRSFSDRPRTTGDGLSQQQSVTDDEEYKAALKILNQYQLSNRQSPTRSPRSKTDTPTARTRLWLRHLGIDIDLVRIPKVIHVAGTKGKGTTCFYVNSILAEHQRTTNTPKMIGCLTSPHQIDVRERILINNKKISKHLFSYYVQKLHQKLDSLSNRQDLSTPIAPKYPAFLSLLAIYIFILEKVDVAILETGIGGETDSTNVFPSPIATGITSIGLDHTDALGHTTEAIAWHKAGIFKPGSLAGTVPQDKGVMDVLLARAKERHALGLHVVTDQTMSEYGVQVSPDLPYQRYNASLAIFLAETYLKSLNPQFAMTCELVRCLEDVKLLGKSQVVQDRENTWFISSAHNEMSLKETMLWFKQYGPRHSDAPRVLIFNQPFSRSSVRDSYPLLNIILEGLRLPHSKGLQGVIFCTDQLDKHQDEEFDLVDFRRNEATLATLQNQQRNSQVWNDLGGMGEVAIVHTVRDAVRLVKDEYKGAEILVAGSSYLAGNVLHILDTENSSE